MAVNKKAVRQSVTLPARVAQQVRHMAKRRRLSANRVLVELVEEGIALQKQKEGAFFELAERFRAATDPKDIERLGDQLGKMMFGKISLQREQISSHKTVLRNLKAGLTIPQTQQVHRPVAAAGGKDDVAQTVVR